MLAVVLMTLLSLVVGGLVLAYVAYPHRGQDVPYLPQVGQWMREKVDQLPLLHEGDEPLRPRR